VNPLNYETINKLDIVLLNGLRLRNCPDRYSDVLKRDAYFPRSQGIELEKYPFLFK